MSLLIVSDLHIRGPSDPAYQALLDLIRSRVRTGDRLVLAGDIFDLFVGDKPLYRERYAEFFSVLAKAGGGGGRIDYIEGNHDFLIRRAFAGIPGFAVHPEELTLEIDGKRFYIAHGDRVDAGDLSYHALRVFFRSMPFELFVRILPGSWVDWIGNRSSRYSRAAKPMLPNALSTEKIERLRNRYRSFAAEKLMHGYDFVVLGHCHDLDEMKFSLGGRSGQYINVGFPPAHGSFLSWSPGEEEMGRERFLPANPA